MLAWIVSLPGHPCCIWEPHLWGVSLQCGGAVGLWQKFSVLLKRRSRESLKTQTGCLGHL